VTNLRLSFKVWRAQRARDREVAYYLKLIKQATTPEAKRDLDGEGSMFLRMRDAEIEDLVTGHLVSKAEQLFIPIPPREDKKYWTESSQDHSRRVLSHAGISQIRDLIRDEQRKNREARLASIEMVSKILAFATGLVGACIGLISMLRK